MVLTRRLYIMVPVTLSSLPRTSVVEGEHSYKLSSDLHTHHGTHSHATIKNSIIAHVWPRVLVHDKYLTGEIQALGSSSIKRKRMKVAKRNTGIEREKEKEKRKERRERRKGRRKRRQITMGHTCHPSTKEVEPGGGSSGPAWL